MKNSKMLNYRLIFLLPFFTYLINFMGEFQIFLYALFELETNFMFILISISINILIIYLTVLIYRNKTSIGLYVTALVTIALLFYNYLLTNFNLILIPVTNDETIMKIITSNENNLTKAINKYVILGGYILLFILGFINELKTNKYNSLKK